MFIKDDEESPSPESDKPHFIERRPPPSKFSSAASRRIASAPVGRTAASLAKAGRAGAAGKAAASSKTGSRAPPPSANPIIPRRAEDWEPWKGILHELYITQNRILRDIIGIMEDDYNLRATPKMYKNQFARWGFFKYAIKRRPRNRAEREAEKAAQASEGALVATNKSPSAGFDRLISPLLHGSNKTRIMQVGLTAVRDYLQGYIDVDNTVKQDMIVIGYEDPCFRYFKTAMDMFDLKENQEGGLLLRLAFLEIERMLSPLTVKAFSDLCFLVPHLLVESHRKDILGAYLRYLARLATVKFGPTHPVAEVVASLGDLVDEPEALMRYIMALSKVNSDTIASEGQMKERTRRWARNQYIACQRTKPDLAAASTVSRGTHAHHMIRVESQSVYWAQHLIMQDPESDELAECWLDRKFPDDFGPKTEVLLGKVKTMGAAGVLPAPYDRMMECLYTGWLNDYYETKEDWQQVFRHGRRGLELSNSEQYQIWSIHLEGLMREHGSAEDAEELRKKRLEHEWFESVRDKVDNLSLG
ncbi:hypothetical protein B0H67DRAFT_597989 [Lasiosphaeris hirsuta]|uniref:Clr5 domain-containing protein n=1 Tax=Lasiosphaeris hirsuta TaxID=260670 RepID=A0AA40E1C6_9PEZI|nr:hypothetical protein B0H67DRAFT_597989 [Lasiosphaeris hirsuta]